MSHQNQIENSRHIPSVNRLIVGELIQSWIHYTFKFVNFLHILKTRAESLLNCQAEIYVPSTEEAKSKKLGCLPFWKRKYGCLPLKINVVIFNLRNIWGCLPTPVTFLGQHALRNVEI